MIVTARIFTDLKPAQQIFVIVVGTELHVSLKNLEKILVSHC